PPLAPPKFEIRPGGRFHPLPRRPRESAWRFQEPAADCRSACPPRNKHLPRPGAGRLAYPPHRRESRERPRESGAGAIPDSLAYHWFVTARQKRGERGCARCKLFAFARRSLTFGDVRWAWL